MITCRLSFPNPLTHLLHIDLKFQINTQASLDLILPAWRPGRYELASFVENIQRFSVMDENGSSLKWHKTRPNIWRVATNQTKEITVSYQYYANKMDAGNSVLDDHQIYINFINCIFYTHLHQTEEINLVIDIPANYKVSCSLPNPTLGVYQAANYQQLVDAPLLASPDLKTLNYEAGGCLFTIAILGACPLTDDEIITDFKKFSESQITAMGSAPTQQYDFIIQSLDYPHYHGVEHQNATVLVLGPNDESQHAAYYEKLMGVASHELFHAWNVTRIRPTELSPYQFDIETMTDTGFVTEGFTTYYGDLFLKQSGVFTQDEYFKEINTLLKRHFENYGRFESTLIQSSQNLWVDGYKNIFPSKKVSIYVKGALCALILDLTIRKNTKHEAHLIEVIKRLYANHTYNKGGYSQADVYRILQEVGGQDLQSLLASLYESTTSLEPLLQKALDFVGCTLISQPHPITLTSKFGIRCQGAAISEIAPGSSAEEKLSVGDEILRWNGEAFHSEKANVLVSNFVRIKRGARLLDINLEPNDKSYFSSYEIAIKTQASDEQLKNLSLWLSNNQK
ncbi:M61 family peptidase [Reichenbachiella carrageenanivorans]|uniref:M61 family peptidase n=1 Tax=Reichenbachiella carrageenanivorans TaxID=2979869 RepID=A0ABY6D0T4_9BACT|nr:M61 family peptidase [Reichenbachiella carrageenanivorans]UXX79766.1 M61 family peptidase [Reichenbachiella carrageenanivorans]